MGFKPIPLVATGVLGLGNLLHIIGLATPEWVTSTVPGIGDVTAGLWERCIRDSCTRLEDEADWLEACRAMAILGMLAGLAALVMAAVHFVLCLMDKETYSFLRIGATAAAAVSFIFILIGIIIFAVKIDDDTLVSYDFGYSFGLDIAGAILILLGGCIAYAGTR